ncbi:MAG: hypothetical protein QM650_09510 [Microlunatus sp.]
MIELHSEVGFAETEVAEVLPAVHRMEDSEIDSLERAIDRVFDNQVQIDQASLKNPILEPQHSQSTPAPDIEHLLSHFADEKFQPNCFVVQVPPGFTPSLSDFTKSGISSIFVADPSNPHRAGRGVGDPPWDSSSSATFVLFVTQSNQEDDEI